MDEERQESFFGRIEGLIRTGQEIILRPQGFFKNLPAKDGYLRPLLFSMVIFCIVLGYNLVLVSSGLLRPDGQGSADSPSLTDALTNVPVLVVLWLFGLILGSLVLHATFKLLKGKGRFESTFSIFAYSSIANLLTIIPSIGHYACTIYTLVLIMLAGRVVHKLSSVRAVAAPILPALVLWGVMMVLVLSGIIPIERLTSSLK